MLTRNQALTCQEFHYEGDGPCTRNTGPRGGVTEHIVRVRRNGMTQTWVTRPSEFRIPVKYGIRARGQFSIRETEAGNYHAAEACPLNGHDSNLEEGVHA